MPQTQTAGSEFSRRAASPTASVCTGRSEKRAMPIKIRQAIREEERETEDQIAQRELGPRGVPKEDSPAKLTPQRKKKLPQAGDFDGHTA